MLIRVSGSSEGVEQYLREGLKRGRDFNRDQLDDRVILDGNLDITSEIISATKGEGDKYLHITLAFKEDEVTTETLKSITQDFKDFAFTAFDSDEYNFYAEAHLPRIKSYNHRQTGEFIERKPHIHIVIPQTNLLSGHKLNPFGLVEHQIQFIDAFQESTNEKYGLASPKDNQRVRYTGESEMISRYKGDIFVGQNKELREQILDELVDRQITSIEDFQKMLSEFGVVRVRNKGKDDEYFNVKLPGADKGVNLKDGVFRKEFIELTPGGKLARLAVNAAKLYETAGPPRASSEVMDSRLEEWRAVRAYEVKYINSGNRRLYDSYRNASPETKAQIIKERESRFYSKYREPEYERADPAGDIQHIRDNLRTADRYIKSVSGTDRAYESIPGNVADRRTRRAFGRAIDAYREGHDRDQGEAGSARTAQLRQRDDSVVGQFAHELAEHRQRTRAEGAEWQEIKQHLDPNLLLSRLEESHGVIPEKYAVSEGRDGSPRIRAGTRNLNVSDFLTKELNLSWSEASAILRDVYADQEGRAVGENLSRRQPPRQQLWQEFQEQRERQRSQRSVRWEEQQLSESTRRQALRQEFSSRRAAIRGNRVLRGARQRAALSVARMERVLQEKALRTTIQTERALLREAARAPLADQYRDFLRAKAEAGDGRALAELRRVSPKAHRAQPASPIGDLIAHGRAPYQHRPGASASYYMTLRGADGNTQTVWGVDFERGLKESGAAIGDRIQLHRQGQQATTIRSRNRGTPTATIHHRVRWQIERLPLDAGEDGLQIEAAETPMPAADMGSEPLQGGAGLTYQVHANGDVSYRIAGTTVLRDEGRTVRVFRASDDDMETALRLARAKFGRRLTLTGSQDFQARAARLAAERNLQIDFTDPTLNELVKTRKAELDLTQQGKVKRTAKDDQGSRRFIEPNTQAGQYTGQVIDMDEEYVYQQHGRDLVRHSRNKFRDSPKIGQTIRIMYLDQQATVEKTHKKERNGPAR